MGGFGERAWAAYKALCYREGGDIPFAEIADRFQRAGGREVPASTVWRWLTGRREPGLADVPPLAVVLGVPEGQLAFGEAMPTLQRAPVAPHLPAKVPSERSEGVGKGGQRRRGSR